MSPFELKSLAAIIILAITVLAAYPPFIKQIKSATHSDFPIGEALASGVFLGAALIHMLADANEQFESLNIHYPIAFLLAGLTFLFLLLLEHIGTEIQHPQCHSLSSPHKNDSTSGIAVLSVIMLSIHSLLAGTALGVSSSIVDITIVFIAIIAHKWAASFSLAVQLNKTTLPLTEKLLLFSCFALMVPLGILGGAYITNVTHDIELLPPTFNALAAGTFLYIGTLHGLNRAVMVKRCCNLREFLFVIIGFLIMSLIAIWT